MAFRILTTLLLSLTSGRGQDSASWTLPQAVRGLRDSVTLPPEVDAGTFRAELRLSLGAVDGTAAAVHVGDRLTFGFDGRQGRFFAEGAAVGRVEHLGKTDTLVVAGQPFVVVFERDRGDRLTVAIEGEPLYSVKLPGRVGFLRVRPQRNVVDLLEARVTGNLVKHAPGASVTYVGVPLVIGANTPIANLLVSSETAGRLRGIGIVTSRTGRGPSLALRTTTGKTIALPQPPADSLDKANASPGSGKPRGRFRMATIIPCDVPLHAGLNRFELLLSAKEMTSTSLRLAIQTVRVRGSDTGVVTSWDVTSKAPAPVLRTAVSIHQRGEHDCHTFRIPGIARTKKGTLLAVYDMRYRSRRDLQGHMDIGLSRSTDSGRTWEKPRPIMDMGAFGNLPEDQNGCSDPNILVDEQTGGIIVSALWTHGKPGTHQWSGRGSEPGFEIGTTTQFLMVRSNDDGKTWTAPENWTRRLKKPEWWLFAPAPGNGITMKDGTLVMPTQGRDEKGLPFSNLMWSRDHGRSWTVSEPARTNTTESAVAELSDGRLLLSMRDNRNRKDKGETNGRAMSVTGDLGATWQVHPADHGALPEPVCMASLIRHDPGGGSLLVFSNPRDRHRRRNMTVQFSVDDGVTFPAEHHVLLDALGGAYSSLVPLDEKTVGILYESSQADLLFQRVTVPTALQR